MNSSPIFQSLGDEEGLRVLLGDSEEFAGGLTKAARTLLPTAGSVGAGKVAKRAWLAFSERRLGELLAEKAVLGEQECE